MTDQFALVRQIASESLGADPSLIEPLAGGFFSSAFGVRLRGEECVVRLNGAQHAREGFAKDEYAGRHFGSLELPIPTVIARGQTDDLYYGISERAAGQMLSELTEEQRRTLIPDLLDKLDAVGRVNLSNSRGFGEWGGDGDGKYPSWRAFLAAIIDDHDDGYYANWQRFYRESFLERDVFERVYHHMLTLSERCPEMRALIHNDYQFENLISDGTRITAVIDWANALYGDPLYDVAWLMWISIHPGWWYDDGEAILRNRFGGAPDFETRIACYSCHIGLDHLRFYAKNDRRGDYDICRNWLLKIIEETS